MRSGSKGWFDPLSLKNGTPNVQRLFYHERALLPKENLRLASSYPLGIILALPYSSTANNRLMNGVASDAGRKNLLWDKQRFILTKSTLIAPSSDYKARAFLHPHHAGIDLWS